MGQRSTPAIWATRGGKKWKKEGSIKQEEDPEREGSENGKRNIVTIRTILVIKLKNYIQELTSSNCAEDDFL